MYVKCPTCGHVPIGQGDPRHRQSVTTILSHMTGKQLRRRPSYEIDVEKVLRACAKHDVVVEIKAHPWRLDLDCAGTGARDFACVLSINPDAHSIPELNHTHWAVEMARKGGVPDDRVLNAMTLPEITRYLRKKRRSLPALPDAVGARSLGGGTWG